MLPLPALHPTDADFAAIRRMAGFYVDKTGLFRDLLATIPVPSGSPPLACRHQFLARPRRFGKTLLINTLEAWFQGLPPGHRANPEGDTAELKGMPADWTSPPWLWAGLEGEAVHAVHGWHPVIRLDLSQLGSPDPAGTRAALRDYMEDRVWQWTARGAPWSSAWPASLLASGPERILRNLIQRLDQAYGRQPVVLVDEYDAPIVNHIGTDRSLEPAVAELREFIRVLKDDEGLLYGVFVTGITRFARHQLFSAANNFVDISDEPGYGALCGFTEEEVDRYLAPYRKALADREPRLEDTAIQTAWRDLYNGYRFSDLPSAPRVYNPFTLTNGVSRVLSEPDRRRAAADGAWPSAWSESGHPGLAARLAGDTRQPLPADVAKGRLPPLPASGTGTLARPDYVRLMLDTGYYTWYGGADGAPAHLNFPNREVAASWIRDIFGVWNVADREANGGLVQTLRTCLAQGDMEGFARHLEDFAFGLAHENLQNEACFRILLQSLFLQMGSPTQSEKSTLGGRADHEIKVDGRMYIIEVKFNRSADEALRQIQDHQYGREHLATEPDTLAVGFNVHLDRTRKELVLTTKTARLAHLLAERTAEPEGTYPHLEPV